MLHFPFFLPNRSAERRLILVTAVTHFLRSALLDTRQMLTRWPIGWVNLASLFPLATGVSSRNRGPVLARTCRPQAPCSLSPLPLAINFLAETFHLETYMGSCVAAKSCLIKSRNLRKNCDMNSPRPLALKSFMFPSWAKSSTFLPLTHSRMTFYIITT